jgi:Mce-associated membrane protein
MRQLRWKWWLTVVAGWLLVAVFVGLSAVGGWLYWGRVQTRGEESARAELPQLAAREIPQVIAYDYQTVERSLTDAYPLLTPDFRQEFQKQANAHIIPEAKKREVVSQANVVGAGMIAAQRDSASVMVYLNRTVTDKSRQPLYDGLRLRVEFKRIGGKWLIADIKPI